MPAKERNESKDPTTPGMYPVHPLPWHGLGVVLDDCLTIQKTQRLSGLDWSVRKEPICFQSINDQAQVILCEVPKQYAIVRNDNNYALGVVGEKYEPFQNDAMFEFMGRFMDQCGAKFETCGSLRNGAVVWAMSQAGDMEYLKGDPIAEYFLFKNGFDADQAVQICFTNIRVVCKNTLILALRNARNSYSVRHTTSVHSQVAAIGEAIAAQQEYRYALRDAMQELIAKKMTSAQIERATIEIVMDAPIDTDIFEAGVNLEQATALQAKNTLKILELHEYGAGADIPGVRGSAYGLFNACVEWADHFSIVRPGERTVAEARFTSIMMGAAHQFKNRAFTYLQNFARAA